MRLAAAPQLAAEGSSRCGAVGEGTGTRGTRTARIFLLFFPLFCCYLFVFFSLFLFPSFCVLFRCPPRLRGAFSFLSPSGISPMSVSRGSVAAGATGSPRPRVGKNRREKDPRSSFSRSQREEKEENGRLTVPGLGRWARTRVASPTRGLGKETSLETHGGRERAVHACPFSRARFWLPTERVPGQCRPLGYGTRQ